MKTNEYKRNARVTLAPAKVSKQGIRANINKQSKVFIGHSISGAVSEILELQEALKPFLLGEQLTDAIRAAARPELGDLFWYTSNGAKDLKVKLPSSTKKVRSKDTITTQILALTDIASNLSGLQKKQYYGVELDIPAVKEQWELLVDRLWPLCLSLFNVTPDVIMAENIVKLKTRYPDAKWDAAAAQHKDHAAESAAVSAAAGN